MSLSITKRIVAKFKLGDEGKLNNFFMKQIKECSKAIRDLKRNKVTVENSYNDSIDDLKERLEDAKEALKLSYEDVNPENVSTNAAALEFSKTYWNKVSLAKDTVKMIEEEIKDLKEDFEQKIKNLDEQIDLYQERIDILEK
jgi:phage shock protein A